MLKAGLGAPQDAAWLLLDGGVLIPEVGVGVPFVEAPFVPFADVGALPTFHSGVLAAACFGLLPPRPGNASSDCVSNKGLFSFGATSSLRLPAALADIGETHPGAGASPGPSRTPERFSGASPCFISSSSGTCSMVALCD